jgi:hypothetical protein
MTTDITTVDLPACFDLFTESAFRLETERASNSPSEAERLAAFRAGLPLPERSVRTSPWLARIHATCTATPPKSWTRIGLVGTPLSEYQRYRMVGRREAEVAGEVNLLADYRLCQELAVLDDFWLFDEGTVEPFAAIMDYGPDGSYLGSQIITSPAAIARCKEVKRLAYLSAIPLETFLGQCAA